MLETGSQTIVLLFPPLPVFSNLLLQPEFCCPDEPPRTQSFSPTRAIYDMVGCTGAYCSAEDGSTRLVDGAKEMAPDLLFRVQNLPH